MMNRAKMAMIAAVLCVSGTVALAYPISLGITQSGAIFLADTVTLLPSGAYAQMWWSADNAYGAVDPATSTLAQSPVVAANGDYVLWSGATTAAGGFAPPPPVGGRTDADVPVNTISSGYIYVYVYEDAAPGIGDSYIRSPIYGPGNTGTGDPWGDAGAPLPPPTDLVNVTSGASMGTHFVVPEPATMALFGIGILTMAARRRRK